MLCRMRKLRRTAYATGTRAAIQKAGGPKALADALNLVPSAVTQWVEIPARHVPAVSELTGLSRHELRPDLWEEAA